MYCLTSRKVVGINRRKGEAHGTGKFDQRPDDYFNSWNSAKREAGFLQPIKFIFFAHGKREGWAYHPQYSSVACTCRVCRFLLGESHTLKAVLKAN